MKVYLCRKMSKRPKNLVVLEASVDRFILETSGITPLCPVKEEDVVATAETLQATKQQMDSFWKRDKQLIREAHVIFDRSPLDRSEGVCHELGLARYCYWKPIIRVFPRGFLPNPASVAYYEDDYITDNLTIACSVAKERWGTRTKRILWRLKMLSKSLPKWLMYQIGEFK